MEYLFVLLELIIRLMPNKKYLVYQTKSDGSLIYAKTFFTKTGARREVSRVEYKYLSWSTKLPPASIKLPVQRGATIN